MRGELGEPAEVEISAVTVMNGGQPCFGFAIRDVGRRLPATSHRQGTLPRSMEHLTELIGRVALKDLVREATDVIERLCIEAALELTGDNRASAAEMLGLSRQSLYVKLRRYGLGTTDAGRRGLGRNASTAWPAPPCPAVARIAEADHLVRADVGVWLRGGVVRPADRATAGGWWCWGSSWPGRWCAAPARR